jgi:outer membrane protein assembly factor BamB
MARRSMSRVFRGCVAVAVIGMLGAAAGVPVEAAAQHSAKKPKTTTISSKELPFDTTNGDVLALRVLALPSGRYLAVAGNFTKVVTKNGKTHKAVNLVVVKETTGSIVYRAKSVSKNGYVRALAYSHGVLYAGGDFTSYDGTARSHIVAINTTTWAATSWNPNAPDQSVYAIAAMAGHVFYAGDSGMVHAVSPTTGATIWEDPVTNGSVRALLLNPTKTGLYIAGFFDAISTKVQHGLVKVNALTGVPVKKFVVSLKKNSAGHPASGGDELALAFDTKLSHPMLIVGSGGSANYTYMRRASTGTKVWAKVTPGDTQAVAVVGNTIVAGYHREGPNGHHNPKRKYYAIQMKAAKGSLTTWNAHLSGGHPTADGGGGGIQASAYDAHSKLLFVGGVFTTTGASCHVTTTMVCKGGTVKPSLAVFTVKH